ncbi:hypothetical protein AAU57_08915 [Nonlabens sp. YIK11]|uniref:hypothetical protein n=1 Tax=Nonlabens sp. YIK11 TaxID=1453349 RepID=UPI0006DCDE91|nr:hypothetical protein [Nonlabens sp. YIK11]KQC33424.1 hypothetical protein AAU57_08915 [Nonlabens sp. YIK11]
MENLQQYCEREFNTQETFNLLKASGAIFYSWGVSKATNYKDAGLLLKVNGHHLDGYVFIVLGWNDVYKVFYLDNNHQLLDSAEGIYCDMLTNEIDVRIEKIDDYK